MQNPKLKNTLIVSMPAFLCACICAPATGASAQPAKIPLNSDAVEWRVKPQAELK